ncbi:polymer-forming cytoskeletal protein [bacterium]|nr:polymer-forming cytoskeletal protein [bacterium]
MDTQYQPQFSEKPNRKKKGCLITFLIVAIILVIILLVGAYFIYRYAGKEIGNFAKQYTEAGYQKQTGQVIEISNDIKSDMLYVCQVLVLDAKLDGSLALLCQTAEIGGEVTGDVDFKGQMLEVTETGKINGNLEIFGQVADIRGEVKGKITGKCSVLSVPLEYRNNVNVDADTINYNERSVIESDIPEEIPENNVKDE